MKRRMMHCVRPRALDQENLTIERRGRKGRKVRQNFFAAFAAFAFQSGVSQSDTLLEPPFTEHHQPQHVHCRLRCLKLHHFAPAEQRERSDPA